MAYGGRLKVSAQINSYLEYVSFQCITLVGREWVFGSFPLKKPQVIAISTTYTPTSNRHKAKKCPRGNSNYVTIPYHPRPRVPNISHYRCIHSIHFKTNYKEHLFFHSYQICHLEVTKIPSTFCLNHQK